MRFVEKWPSRMQGQWFFWKLGGAGKSFRAGPENPGFFVGKLLLPESTFPKGSYMTLSSKPKLTFLKEHQTGTWFFAFWKSKGNTKGPATRVAAAGIRGILLGEPGVPLPHGRQERRRESQLAAASGKKNFQAIVPGSPWKVGKPGTGPTSTLHPVPPRDLLECEVFCWPAAAECCSFLEDVAAGDWVPLVEHSPLIGSDVVVGG